MSSLLFSKIHWIHCTADGTAPASESPISERIYHARPVGKLVIFILMLITLKFQQKNNYLINLFLLCRF